MTDDARAGDGAHARLRKPEVTPQSVGREHGTPGQSPAFAGRHLNGYASQAMALQRTAGNAATRQFLRAQVQRKLPKGLAPATRVVRHEERGDAAGFTIVKSSHDVYTINGPDGTEHKGISGGNAEWGTEEGAVASRAEWEQVRAKKAANEPAEILRKQLLVGENYLGSDYKRINPLLAALEMNGYTSPQVRDKAFDYSARKSDILADMKRIAVTRTYTTEGGAAAWDEREVDAVYAILRTILDVWDVFPKPEGAGGAAIATVYRGDSRFLFDSFPRLNPAVPTNNLVEGPNDVAIDVSMPGILSTTFGDPREHNFVKGKTVVWDIQVPPDSEGRSLGTNNPAEKELSFPIGTVLHVTNIVVRIQNKSAQAGTYGDSAEVILKAHI